MEKYLFVQLGSPKYPDAKSLRIYLKEFLGDPRVIDLPKGLWWVILNLFILPFRPKKSAQLYKRLWDGQGFPLIKNSELFLERMRENGIDGHLCFLLSEPRLSTFFIQQKPEDYRQHHWIIVPLFPQYCEATTASVYDQLHQALMPLVVIPSFEFVPYFYHTDAFIDGIVRNILSAHHNHSFEAIVISFHGIPLRRVILKNDPYYAQCRETISKITTILEKNGITLPIKMAFQSRFGSEQWIEPYLESVILKLKEEFAISKIGIATPSFVADCLETLDEIGHELKETMKEEEEIDITLIPSLNGDPQWCKEFSEYLLSDKRKLEKQQGFFQMSSIPADTPKLQSPPLTKQAKSAISIVFLTLFLDLVGFSIIFPLFPSMAKYYLENDANNIFLQGMFNFIQSIFTSSGFSNIVLFGGLLGALYSLLQFLAAPFWGSLSDKIGRRPVLLISLFFLIISYGLWFVAGSFTLLICSRIVGGLMAGNISTASAVVADVTQKENRSKGMAFVGLAFALGFILGPAIGGISSKIDLTQSFPDLNLAQWGVNPFSMPAAVAFCLSVFNLVWIYFKFPETLSAESKQKAKESHFRSSNPLLLFRPLPFSGVNITNYGHFLFLLAFSGMEFTLTFLAAERLGFTSLQNAYMFIFIGFILAMVQGGFVRRKAHLIGEKKLTLMGLILLVPGLLAIGLTQNILFLYVGLFFLAMGAGMIIPCMTSLVSLLTPPEHQGRALGVFRSLGALSRVLGPLMASIVYWKFGSSYPYFFGTLFLIIPFFLIKRLPKDGIHAHA